MQASIHMTWPQYLRGECTVRVNGFDLPVHLSRHEKEMLLLLLLRRPAPSNTTQLIEFMWPNPDDEPEQAENAVKVYISRLRRKLGKAFIKLLRNSGSPRHGIRGINTRDCGYIIEDIKT